MSKLREALRKKFRTPREAIIALGLDESLLVERAYDSKPLTQEKTMKKVKLSALGTVAYGSLMTFIRPQLAMDAKIDLTRGLRNINAKNFKAKRPTLAAWITESVADKLDPQFAQDGALDTKGLDAVLDMIELAMDDFPDDMEKKKDEKEKKAEDEDMDDETTEDEDMDDEEKKKAMMEAKKAKDKKAKDMKPKAGAKDKKAKDEDVNEEDEEHDPDTAEEMSEDDDMETAMDAKIQQGIEAGIHKERQRMEAVSAAKDHVRPRVGNLSMAFDSAGDVYRKALKMVTGKEPPKKADVETLKYAYDNLPNAAKGQKQTYAMDSASTTSANSNIVARNPELAKNMARIKNLGRQ